MNAYQTTYGKNTTSMSDADLYGRSPALGVDIDACKRAAAREVAGGLRGIIHGSARVGSIKIRIAAIRLSIALGNQSEAESYLDTLSYQPQMFVLKDYDRAAEKADKAQLDAAVNRDYAHPALAETLADLESRLAEALKNSH